MNESAVRKIAGALGITITMVNSPWLNASCPLAPWRHKGGTDRTPSFGIMINDEGETYYKCLACKSKGRMSTLVRQLERYRGEEYRGLAFEADRLDYMIELPTYEEMQAQRKEKPRPEPLNEAAYGNLYPSVFATTEAYESHPYLRKRNITPEAAELLDLRYDPEERRVVFPVRDKRGGLYGFTGRSILPEGALPHTGYRKQYPKVRDYAGLPKEFLLLGENLFQPDLPVLVVEGLFGYASLVSIGARELCNPVALMGSEMTRYKAEKLVDLEVPVYLLTDNDEAGDACLFGTPGLDGKHHGGGAIDSLRGNVPLFIPEWPSGKTDPDELDYDEVAYMLQETIPQ